MILPNAQRAVVQIEKLRDYCLDPIHPRGKHKARVFASALGVRSEHADWLRSRLLDAAQTTQALELEKSEFGKRYLVRFEVTGLNGQTATILSFWLVRFDEDFPRLTTCFIK